MHEYQALGCLLAGVICAIVSRILLLIAACRISIGWAFGVLLPFGPLFFRLNYPDEARSSFYWRLATLPCFGLFFLLGSGPQNFYTHNKSWARENAKTMPTSTTGYAMEKPADPEEQRQANVKEFERLRAWNEALKLKKRDLLHSDVEGTAAYNKELAEYNAAAAKATAERAALWPAAK